MAERYTRLFALPGDLYTEGAPLLVAAGALLKDTVTGRVLAQLKFTNICDKNIKAVKVRVTPFDTVGRPMSETVPFTYLDLAAARDTNFGQKVPIPLAESEARSFAVTVEEVAFADNSLWTLPAGAVWEPLPAPQTVETVLRDGELVKQYTLKYGQNHTLWPQRIKDLWRCSCGALNRTEEKACHWCSWTIEDLDIDIEALKAEAAERVEQERIAAERAAEEARIAAERAAEEARLAAERAAREAEAARKKAAKRNKRIAAAVLSITTAGALAWVFHRYAWPPIKTELAYREAQAAFEAGEYEQARAEFKALADYKEAPALLQESIYQQAESLLEAGDYAAAKKNYTELEDYKDAAEKSKEADYRLAADRMTAGDFAAAQKLYKSLGEYKDAADQLEEAGYQAALQAVADGEYEAAVDFFQRHKYYKDCAQQLIEAAYPYGCELLKNKEYARAVAQFNKCLDKEDAAKKRLEAEYGYVSTHREYTNQTTYVYAKELIEQGYPGVQEIYDEIFKLRVKIVLSDSDDYPSTSDTLISKYSKVYCDIQLQGEPGKKVRLYAIYTWPKSTSDRWNASRDCTVGSWTGFYTWLTDPPYNYGGTFTVKVYDSATGSLLGEDSVQII